MAIAGGVSRWTRYVAMASAVSMVLLQIAILADVTLRAVAGIGLFGAVLPMVFGMAYLLVPSSVGRTLSTQHLPGIHFGLAYIGAGLLAGSAVFELGETIVTVGSILWSAGVVIFVGTLLYTVVPAVVTDPEIVLRSEGRPRRSTRLSTIMIPVAIGYLLLGTLSLLGMRLPVPDVGNTTLPVVVDYYAAGFTTLLIFALGIRLLTGFSKHLRFFFRGSCYSVEPLLRESWRPSSGSRPVSSSVRDWNSLR